MTFGSLFSGIGGLDLGLERAGMTCKWQVEIDPYCTKVLEKHWPGVKRYGDIRTVTAAEHVDLIAGGFPCQDISHMGKRAGLAGHRSGLWSEMLRIVGEIRPDYVLVENVSGLLVRGAWRVLADLAEIGFDAEWDTLRAGDFGAPHERRARYSQGVISRAFRFGYKPPIRLLEWMMGYPLDFTNLAAEEWETLSRHSLLNGSDAE